MEVVNRADDLLFGRMEVVTGLYCNFIIYTYTYNAFRHTPDDYFQLFMKYNDFNDGIVLPTLIKQIKSVLDQYPDDGQILKEVIQNAEDAGATRVVFLIDHSTYGSDRSLLYDERLAKFQGPALCVYNDAVFRDEDWKGIRLLHDSIKEKDPMKVGRFGLGFKSVYHMTDLPSIFSGKGIAFIDPHMKHFKTIDADGQPTSTSSFLFHLTKHGDLIAKFRHQFEPFVQDLFGVSQDTMKDGFEGTIFRLPFRTAKNIKGSDLSTTLYDVNKVKRLVQSLLADAHHMLLFLKNLEVIQVFEKSGPHDQNPRRLLDIRISQTIVRSVREKRQDFRMKITERTEKWTQNEAIAYTYPVAIDVVESIDARQPKLKTTNWLISQYHAGKSDAAGLRKQDDLKYLPLVGAALNVDSGIELCTEEPHGHVFCFLPLPLERKSPTGLRIHVNGCFAVEQNRRHIKWPTADQSGKLEDPALVWNQFLVNSLLPKCMSELISFIIKVQQKNDETSRMIPHELGSLLSERSENHSESIARLVYAILPDPSAVAPQWKAIVAQFCEKVASKRQFFYSRSSDAWMQWKDVIFDQMESCDRIDQLFRDILYADRKNVASVPTYVMSLLPTSAVKMTPDAASSSLRSVQDSLLLSNDDRRILLSYFCENLTSDAGFCGLQLLPLANGTWTKFEKPSSTIDKVYVDSVSHSRHLLPGLAKCFLDKDKAPPRCTKMADHNSTQLCHLGPDSVCKLLHSLFSPWQSRYDLMLDEVPKDIGMNYKWLVTLWKYLQVHCQTTLHRLEKLHLIPLTKNHLVRLSSSSPILAKVDAANRTRKLPEDIVSVCELLKIDVIFELEPEVRKHSEIWNKYILPPTPNGFVTALTRLQSSCGRQSVTERFCSVVDASRRCVLNFLAGDVEAIRTAAEDTKYLLKSLPLFVTVHGSGGQESHFVSLEQVTIGQAVEKLSTGKVPIPSSKRMLDLDDGNTKKLAAVLGIKPMPIAELVSSVYLPAVLENYYNKDDTQMFMLFICDRIKEFEKTLHFGEIIKRSREVPFVPTVLGPLARPCDLFDSHDDTLNKLFCNIQKFPVDDFAKTKYRDALLSLGLKTVDSVGMPDIVVAAELLSTSGIPTEDKQKSAGALMCLLNRRPSLLNDQPGGSPTLRDKLLGLRWVTVSAEYPSNYPSSLPYASSGTSDSLALPSDVRSLKYANLIGSVRPLINTKLFPHVAKTLHWDMDPCMDDIVQHSRNVLHCFRPDEKSSYLYVMQSVYKYLDENPTKITEWLNKMERFEWIWNGESFSDKSAIVLKRGDLDLKPYIFTLPPELQRYNRLWLQCKLRDKVEMPEVLHAIRDAPNKVTNDFDENHGVQLAVTILNNLSRQSMNSELKEKLLVPIQTKDGKLVMKYSRECVYCDKEWFQNNFNVGEVAENVVHELLPVKTAEQLNIPNIVSRTIGAEELDISYGQSEPLTTRLKSILSDYTDGIAVLKELIQNADDAKATEIRFLYDGRSNDKHSTILLDQGMKAVHGPALWTFNDAVFSNTDFANIVKLGGATKNKECDKIGRFGLGFNAVYNLTDVPSFVSGNFVTFFDPHAKYLGKMLTDKSKPGIKLNLKTHRNQIQAMSDQFHPYNGVFGCDLSVNSPMTFYDGTLFRFPLRTSEQALKSEISRVCYDDEEIRKLLLLLYDASHQLLLYTQRVHKIEVFHLSADSTSPNEMTCLFSVTKQNLKELRHRVIPRLPVVESDRAAALSMCNSLLKDCRKRGKQADKPVAELSFVCSISVNCTDVFVKSHADGRATGRTSYWLVSWCMGTDDSLDMAMDDETLVPIGSVAVRLNRVDDDSFQLSSVQGNVDSYGTVFCFMPLPLKYSLPVHINGYFAVHSSRTHLYEQSAMDKHDKKARWNKSLMTDAVSKSYVNLLIDLTSLCPMQSAYSAWPVTRSLAECTQITSLLYETFYRHVCASRSPHVVMSDSGWVQLLTCRMLSPEFRRDEIAELAISILKQVAPPGINIIDLPMEIIKTILQTGCSNGAGRMLIGKKDFILDWFLPNIGKVNRAVRDNMVIHCIISDDLKQHLGKWECIPVSPHGETLKSIAELVHPESELALLFDVAEERFPMWNGGIDDSTRQILNNKLVSLGMKKDRLSWEEIAERCCSLEARSSADVTCAQIITRLMATNLRNGENPERSVLKRCKKSKFLPKMRRPSNYPFMWKGDEFDAEDLTSCEEAYLRKHQNLVCSSYPVIHEKSFPEDNSDDVKSILGLKKKQVGIATVISQINEVTKECTWDGLTLDDHYYDDVFVFFDKLLRQERMSGSDLAMMMCLTEKRCIRIDTTNATLFMEPRKCAIESSSWSTTMLPYLAVVPSTKIKLYPNVLRKLGIKQTFSIEDYIHMIEEMHGNIGDRNVTDVELHTVLHVINECIYNAVTQGVIEDAFAINNRLLVPNAAGKLCLSSTLCFNNCTWLVTPADEHCSHTQISFPIAEAIGIKTYRTDIVRKHRVNDKSEPFGQKEPLVRRIRRILDSYSCNEDILKEMLQNADDSGATEIHFILDTRRLPSKRIFADSWEPLQGPALRVFNNRSFTEDDLDGIQELGQGSKGSDLTKTGQYGVGFNCIYHITDVPSFITTVSVSEHESAIDEGSRTIAECAESTSSEKSRKVLCAFDPNCKYVPDADKFNPGGMYTVDDELRNNFSDVFAGYINDYFDLTQPGTMFRFPLRSEKMAEESEISKRTVQVADMQCMFQTFKTYMNEMLLFVKSLDAIYLETVSTDGNPSTYSVEVRMSPQSKKERDDFISAVEEAGRKLRDGELNLSDIESREVEYEMTITDGENRTDVWHVVQRFGFHNFSSIPIEVVEAYDSKKLNCLPLGGVAYLKNATRGCVKSRIFCSLPLPVQIDELPVSINGHFVLDHESRRNLWTENEKSYKFEWNRCIMENVIAPAYVTLIYHTSNTIRTSSQPIGEHMGELSTYYRLFPDLVESTVPLIKSMVDALYKHIGEENVALFPILSSVASLKELKWTGPLGRPNKKAFFDDLDMHHVVPLLRRNYYLKQEDESEQVREDLSMLRNSLTNCGVTLIMGCPIRIFTNFAAANVAVETSNPEAIVKFFATYRETNSQCKIGKLPSHVSRTAFKNVTNVLLVLKYSKLETKKEQLEGLPLLLTKDEHLRVFDADLKFVTKHSNVAPHAPNVFIHTRAVTILGLDPAKDEMCCKAFGMSDFAQLLATLLPPHTYCGSDRGVDIEELEKELTCKTKSETTELSSGRALMRPGGPSHNQLPEKYEHSREWLRSLWRFIASFSPAKQGAEECDHKQFYETLISPIRDWCLLPVDFAQKKQIVPVHWHREVLHNTWNPLSESMWKIVTKIGIARLLSEFTDDYVNPTKGLSKLMDNLLVDIDIMHECVLLAIKRLMDAGIMNTQLTTHERLTIMQYFSRYCVVQLESGETRLKDLSDIEKDNLRSLPWFETIHDTAVSIRNAKAYVIPREIPFDGLKCLTQEVGMVWLKNESNLQPLFACLQCNSLTVTDVYSDYICKDFGSLSANERSLHLTFIKRYMANLKNDSDSDRNDSKQQHQRLESDLIKLRFLPSDSNPDKLVKASYYYDYYADDITGKVMRTILKRENFPPPPYDSEEWSTFLRYCGIQHEITDDMFLKFARSIEQRVRESVDGADDVITVQSSILVQHFMSRDLQSPSFLEKLRSIMFITPHRVCEALQRIHPQYEPTNSPLKQQLISFEGSYLKKDEQLTWTIGVSLPFTICESRLGEQPHQQVTRQQIMQILNVFESPTEQEVVANIWNICSTWHGRERELRQNSELVPTFVTALKHCYDFIKSHKNRPRLSSETVSILSKTPCIFLEDTCQLVKPCQCASDITSEEAIRPYLHRLPGDFAQFEDIFLSLGCTKKITILQCSDILASIHMAVGDQQLDNNELNAAMKAMRKLFEILDKDQGDCVSFSNQLYLLSTMEKLVLSTNLVYEDRPSLSKRLEGFNEPYMIDPKECGVVDSILAERLLMKIDVSDRPKFLSRVVIEEIDSCCDESPSDFVEQLQVRLKSEMFLTGFDSIVRHNLIGMLLSDEQKEEKVLGCLESLKRINIVGRKQLITYLTYNGETIANSQRDSDYFIHIDEITGSWIVSVNNNLSSTGCLELYAELTELICRVIGNFATLAPLNMILQCPVNDIINVLGKQNIAFAVARAISYRITVGNYVPQDRLGLLIQDLFLFQPGMLVALEMDDPLDRDEHGPATYLLVEIVRRVRTEHEPLFSDKYVVRISFVGNEEKTVDACVLYAFGKIDTPQTTTDNASDSTDHVTTLLELCVALVPPGADKADYLQSDHRRNLDNFEAIIGSIKDSLKEAWTISDQCVRRKIIKRLQFAWHPDKNPNNVELCTRVFQMLNNLIGMLEEGLSIDNVGEHEAQCNAGKSGQRDRSTYEDAMRRRARQYWHQEQTWHKRKRNSRNRAGNRHRRKFENENEREHTEYTEFFTGFYAHNNPQPGEANRWMKQAKHDLETASNGLVIAHEWTCYMCYQSAEKALYAVHFAQDANYKFQPNGKDTLPNDFPDKELNALVDDLQSLVHDSLYLRYPSEHPFPLTPHEVIDRDTSSRALEVTTVIVEMCQKFVDATSAQFG